MGRSMRRQNTSYNFHCSCITGSFRLVESKKKYPNNLFLSFCQEKPLTLLVYLVRCQFLSTEMLSCAGSWPTWHVIFTCHVTPRIEMWEGEDDVYPDKISKNNLFNMCELLFLTLFLWLLQAQIFFFLYCVLESKRWCCNWLLWQSLKKCHL